MSRLVLRAFAWLVLLSLPFTLTPALTGTISGIFWGPWNSRQVWANTDKFLYDVKDALNDWGVGGGVQTFREYQDTTNDFHTLRINSNDWAAKLGFLLPNEYTNFEGGPDEAGIDKLADLEHLMRDVNLCLDKKKEQWLYFSDLAWPSIFPWDEAFDEVVQRAYVDPKLNQSDYYFAQCSDTAGFLCGVWSTRAPALLHFLVEDEPLDPDEVEEGLTYATPMKDLRPVTVRLIEFPLKDEYVGISLSTFPSSTEQMLAIVSGDRLYEQFDHFFAINQMFTRFLEHMDTLWDAEGTLLHYLNLVDNWMIDHVTKPLGIKVYMEYLYAFSFILFGALSTGICTLITFVDELFGAFLGRPGRGDWVMGGDWDENETPEDRFWGPMMGGFWEDMERRIAEEKTGGGDPSAQATMTSA